MQKASATSKENGTTGQTFGYATIAADILRDLAQASHIPFLQNAAAAISERKRTRECSRASWNSYTSLHVPSFIYAWWNKVFCPSKYWIASGSLSKTLQKVQTSVQFQQELGKIKRLFRQHEIGGQLRAYEVELQTILNTFKIQNGATLATDLVELELDAQQRHQELVALLCCSKRWKLVRISKFRSNSIFSVLPPVPKFLHGREAELTLIATALQIQPVHLAILGPGGMGKTTLAVTALHHTEVVSKYEQRHFVSCESAFENSRLVNIIAAHLRLEPSKHLSTAITTHFRNCGTTLLVLDNLETVWEEAESRAEVEELLSLLSEITMRGAERPAKVKWTHPFLPPLEPLHPSASRQTFIEIADLPPSEEESALEELLALSGNLPLAVSLMATVASYEGYSNTLRRWKIESTALLSEGHDKRSNLETSIMLSLSSPRMLSSPNAKNLLILLSFLPDGLSEVDMLSRDALDIPNILKCREALVRTSLAYVDQGRLKALTPIRQYMKGVYLPPHEAVERLYRHWDTLLTLWRSHKELPSRELMSRLTSNLGNIDSVTQITLSRKHSDEEKWGLMRSILSLHLFSQNVLKGKSPLAQHVVDHIHSSGDRRLHWEYICSCLDVANYYDLEPAQAEAMIERGVQFYEQEGDASARYDFYKFAARYHYLSGNLSKALQFNQLGMTEAEEKNIRERLRAVKLTVDLHRSSITHSVSGQRLAEEKATSYWTTRLRHASDLCQLGRDILVTYGHESSSWEVNMVDIEAGVMFDKSDYDEACRLYEGVARMTDQDRHPYFHANSLLNMVKIDQTVGRDEAHVLRGLAVAEQAVVRLDWKQGILFCERLMAGVRLARGDTAAAREGYISCFQSSRVGYMIPGMTLCLEMLGDLRHGMSNVETTFHWAGTFFAAVLVYRDVVLTYQALRCLGDIFLAEGDDETALNVFNAVLQGATEMDAHRRRADCMVRIGDVLMARGECSGGDKDVAGRPAAVYSFISDEGCSVSRRSACTICGCLNYLLRLLS
ncbi:hypothetical protein B0H14DRAFT_3145662 [Mycena olivaceomarginata]|nr:hypothetical protein B0H14DRAFT_3145662 [Mycena olivaceomarginata]